MPDERDRVAKEVMEERLDLALRLHDTRDYLRALAVLGSPIQSIRGTFDLMSRDGADAWAIITRRMHLVPEGLAGLRASLEEGLAQDVRATRRQAVAVAGQAEVWSGQQGGTPAFFHTLVDAFDEAGVVDASLRTDLEAGAEPVARPVLPVLWAWPACERTLDWPEIAAMRRGGITIGSHTKSHVSLPAETPAVIAEELEGSRQALEAHLGEPIAHFAYPGGQFTTPVIDAVGRAGYQFAYTACQHGDPDHRALTIERLLLWEGSSVDGEGQFSPAILNCQTQDLWPPARKCRRVHDVRQSEGAAAHG